MVQKFVKSILIFGIIFPMTSFGGEVELPESKSVYTCSETSMSRDYACGVDYKEKLDHTKNIEEKRKRTREAYLKRMDEDMRRERGRSR